MTGQAGHGSLRIVTRQLFDENGAGRRPVAPPQRGTAARRKKQGIADGCEVPWRAGQSTRQILDHDSTEQRAVRLPQSAGCRRIELREKQRAVDDRQVDWIAVWARIA